MTLSHAEYQAIADKLTADPQWAGVYRRSVLGFIRRDRLVTITSATGRILTEPKLSRPVQVAEAIKDWMVEQGLQPGDRLPGDRLPGEADLIERFGMAKGMIREAMRVLEAQGLIKTRTGPGGSSLLHEVSRQRTKALLGNYFYAQF